MMSDSSIPSIIRQDITRTNSGFQSAKQQPQNEFKALFTKLNQQQQNSTLTNSTDNKQMIKPVFPSYETNGQNNLLPAFSFLKSHNQHNFHQQPSYFNNTSKLLFLTLLNPLSSKGSCMGQMFELDISYIILAFIKESFHV